MIVANQNFYCRSDSWVQSGWLSLFLTSKQSLWCLQQDWANAANSWGTPGTIFVLLSDQLGLFRAAARCHWYCTQNLGLPSGSTCWEWWSDEVQAQCRGLNLDSCSWTPTWTLLTHQQGWTSCRGFMNFYLLQWLTKITMTDETVRSLNSF